MLGRCRIGLGSTVAVRCLGTVADQLLTCQPSDGVGHVGRDRDFGGTRVRGEISSEGGDRGPALQHPPYAGGACVEHMGPLGPRVIKPQAVVQSDAENVSARRDDLVAW
jgi:hypothetical protein